MEELDVFSDSSPNVRYIVKQFMTVYIRCTICVLHGHPDPLHLNISFTMCRRKTGIGSTGVLDSLPWELYNQYPNTVG